MKTLSAIVLGTVLGLSGCAVLQGMTEPLHGSQTSQESAQMRSARVAVDEANAALTALNTVIGNNAQAGVWTKAEAQAYLDLSKEYGRRVDKARELLRGGLLVDAKSQAEAVKALILALHKKAAESARKV